VADVPGERGHGPLLGVHDGVLDDVGRAGHVLRQVALHPARPAARLGQQAPGLQAVGRCDLSEDDVLGQDMVTEGEDQYWINTERGSVSEGEDQDDPGEAALTCRGWGTAARRRYTLGPRCF